MLIKTTNGALSKIGYCINDCVLGQNCNEEVRCDLDYFVYITT